MINWTHKIIRQLSVPTTRGLPSDESYSLNTDLRRISPTVTRPTALAPLLTTQTPTYRATIASPTHKMPLISRACKAKLRSKGKGTRYKTAISVAQSRARVLGIISNYSRTLPGIKRISTRQKEFRTRRATQASWPAMQLFQTPHHSSHSPWSQLLRQLWSKWTSQRSWTVRTIPRSHGLWTETRRTSNNLAKRTCRTPANTFPASGEAPLRISWATRCIESSSIRTKWANTRARIQWCQWDSWSNSCSTWRPSILKNLTRKNRNSCVSSRINTNFIWTHSRSIKSSRF